MELPYKNIFFIRGFFFTREQDAHTSYFLIAIPLTKTTSDF